MNNIKKLFTDHPESVGETYLHHMKNALIISVTMLIAGITCFIHAIFPFLFKDIASDLLIKMMTNFVKRMPNSETRTKILFEALKKKYESN